jgi:hypothetical protein
MLNTCFKRTVFDCAEYGETANAIMSHKQAHSDRMWLTIFDCA